MIRSYSTYIIGKPTVFNPNYYRYFRFWALGFYVYSKKLEIPIISP